MFYVYKITNKINGKVYIGKAENPHERWKRHVSDALSGRPPKNILHKSIRKRGKNNYILEIIDQSESEKLCLLYEQHWISYYQCNVSRYGRDAGYNKTDGGEGTSGYFPSNETKKKMAIARKKRKYKPLTKEARLKISITKKKNGSNRGSKSGNTSLTEDIVAEIKGLLTVGASNKYIRQKYNLTHSIVSHIKNKVSWTHVKPVIPTNITDDIKLTRRGEDNNASKLTERQVKKIKILLSTGKRISDIAKMFSVSWSLIKFIKLGTIWTHIK